MGLQFRKSERPGCAQGKVCALHAKRGPAKRGITGTRPQDAEVWAAALGSGCGKSSLVALTHRAPWAWALRWVEQAVVDTGV